VSHAVVGHTIFDLVKDALTPLQLPPEVRSIDLHIEGDSVVTLTIRCYPTAEQTTKLLGIAKVYQYELVGDDG
jgi:hypothetical protein